MRRELLKRSHKITQEYYCILKQASIITQPALCIAENRLRQTGSVSIKLIVIPEAIRSHVVPSQCSQAQDSQGETDTVSCLSAAQPQHAIHADVLTLTVYISYAGLKGGDMACWRERRTTRPERTTFTGKKRR